MPGVPRRTASATKGRYIRFAALKEVPDDYAHPVLSVERLLMGTSLQEAIVHTPPADSDTAQVDLSTGEDFPCTYCKGRMLYPNEGGGSFTCSHCDKPFVIVRCPDCREMRGIQTDQGMTCWRCGHGIPTGR